MGKDKDNNGKKTAMFWMKVGEFLIIVILLISGTMATWTFLRADVKQIKEKVTKLETKTSEEIEKVGKKSEEKDVEQDKERVQIGKDIAEMKGELKGINRGIDELLKRK